MFVAWGQGGGGGGGGGVRSQAKKSKQKHIWEFRASNKRFGSFNGHVCTGTAVQGLHVTGTRGGGPLEALLFRHEGRAARWRLQNDTVAL